VNHKPNVNYIKYIKKTIKTYSKNTIRKMPVKLWAISKEATKLYGSLKKFNMNFEKL
jgi:hypothetical protein